MRFIDRLTGKNGEGIYHEGPNTNEKPIHSLKVNLPDGTTAYVAGTNIKGDLSDVLPPGVDRRQNGKGNNSNNQ